MKEGRRRFAASKPGHRFRERYRRRQQSEHGWRDPRRLFYVVGGLIVAVGSLVLGVLPGPGTLTFFLGLTRRRRVPSRCAPLGLGRGEGKEAGPLGRRYLEIVGGG